MRLYILAWGFLSLSAFIMGSMLHGDLVDFQLWMPITVAFSILAAMLSVGAELFMVTMGATMTVQKQRVIS